LILSIYKNKIRKEKKKIKQDKIKQDKMELRNNKIIMCPGSGLTMVFDVETTGLLPKKKEDPPTIDQYPYITQLSYVIYEKKTDTILKSVNHYIKIPENIEIPEIVVKITGITKEICNTKGISIVDALTEFYHDMNNCDIIVAHNYSFDYQIIQAEMKRNYDFIYKKCKKVLELFTPEYLETQKKRYYCTMQMSIYICKLPFQRKTTTTTKVNAGVNVNPTPYKMKKVTYKFPKLSELHQHLFGFVPENLHDAQVDVETCLRCYKMLTNL
jgi:DNA polymerase III epsilon subunit-like protein